MELSQCYFLSIAKELQEETFHDTLNRQRQSLGMEHAMCTQAQANEDE